jgi:flagellar hook-associated protein 2
MGSLKAGLAGLQIATQALKSSSGYGKMQATSGNSTVLGVTASASAVAGKHQVEVVTLAKAQQVRSADFSADAEVGTGTLSITVGSADPVTITIDEDNNTLAGIAGAINKAGAGVTAAVIHDGNGKYYLTMAAKETGLANEITLGNVDQGLSALYTDSENQTLTTTQPAVNAALKVNGIEVDRSGNTISDLIEGVTITLKQADEGKPFELIVARDSSTVTSNIKDFVKQYNSLIDSLKLLRGYNSETKKAGLLQGDSLTRQIEGQVRAFIHKQTGDSTQTVRRLSDLGLSLDKDGKLSLNETTLNKALVDNRAEVETFFAGTEPGKEGFAVQLNTMLDGYLKSSTGLLAAKEKGLASSATKIVQQVERIEFRLSKREEMLRRQFESLELLLGQFQNTSGVLTQQLDALGNLSAQIYKNK